MKKVFIVQIVYKNLLTNSIESSTKVYDLAGNNVDRRAKQWLNRKLRTMSRDTSVISVFEMVKVIN